MLEILIARERHNIKLARAEPFEKAFLKGSARDVARGLTGLVLILFDGNYRVTGYLRETC